MEQSETGSSAETDGATPDLNHLAPQEDDAASERPNTSAKVADDEASKKVAMASNPLASNRGTSLPKNASNSALLPGLDDEDAGESLADIVREVRYRPPTRLAGIGSSIVLVIVAGLWIAGDGKANAKASGAVESEDAVEIAIAPSPGVPLTRSSQDGPSLPAAPASAPETPSEASLEEARQLARERADQERALQVEADRVDVVPSATDPVASLSGTVPQDLPADGAGADPEIQVPDTSAAAESDEDAELAAQLASEDEPESIEFEAGDTDVLPVGEPSGNPSAPQGNRVPKLTKKQQRTAAQAHYKAASVAFMQGNLAASENGFKAALKADPTLATSHRGLGLVYERRGSLRQAASSLRRYLKQAPRAKDAAAIRARLDRLGK